MAETILSSGMESLMDFGLQVILVPLLVFAIVFAVLQKTKILGEKADLNAFVAVAVALILAVVPNFTGFLMTYIPFIAGILIVLFGGTLVFMVLGASVDDIVAFMKRSEVVTILVIIILAYTFYAVGVWFGSDISPYANNTSGAQNSVAVEGISRITNPAVMGTIIFMILAALTVHSLISSSMKK